MKKIFIYGVNGNLNQYEDYIGIGIRRSGNKRCCQNAGKGKTIGFIQFFFWYIAQRPDVIMNKWIHPGFLKNIKGDPNRHT